MCEHYWELKVLTKAVSFLLFPENKRSCCCYVLSGFPFRVKKLNATYCCDPFSKTCTSTYIL